MPAGDLVNVSLTEDGQTSELNWLGGLGTVAVFGTFGSGTAKLQASFDQGSTWVDVGLDTQFTADGIGNFDLPGGVLLRVDLSGSSSPSLTVNIADRRA